jgi:hypothetical protein
VRTSARVFWVDGDRSACRSYLPALRVAMLSQCQTNPFQLLELSYIAFSALPTVDPMHILAKTISMTGDDPGRFTKASGPAAGGSKKERTCVAQHRTPSGDPV